MNFAPVSPLKSMAVFAVHHFEFSKNSSTRQRLLYSAAIAIASKTLLLSGRQAFYPIPKFLKRTPCRRPG